MKVDIIPENFGLWNRKGYDYPHIDLIFKDGGSYVSVKLTKHMAELLKSHLSENIEGWNNTSHTTVRDENE